ncbi:hypothetical protein [Brevibacterium moorei]|uniref:hypothetical protein n=1 Tax=Brevibacterium moorei TaxID=2968457 RepID=UPI00211BED2F|nr:hypothetical protein [Brevibacterium sp. 68QC2CO]MCQ9385115.1 hypothetical protein [Brevibacterium sp. 68QC2CO]
MALRIIGAVGVRVRPEAKGFRPEAERQIRRQMAGADDKGYPVKLSPEVDNDQFARQLKAHKKQMQREMEDLAGTFNSTFDYGFNGGRGIKQFTASARKMRSDYGKEVNAMERMNKQMLDNFVKDSEKAFKKFNKNPGEAGLTSGLKGRNGVWLANMKSIAKMVDEMESSDRRLKENLDQLQLLYNGRRQSARSKYLRDYINWGKQVRATNAYISKTNFKPVVRAMREIGYETENATGLMEHMRDTLAEVGRNDFKNALGDNADHWARAYIEAERFRREWEKIPDQDRKTLAIQLQIDDNERLEKLKDDVDEFSRSLGDMNAPELKRTLDGLVEGTEKYNVALKEYETRLQRLKRVKSGWEGLRGEVDFQTLQAEDNARIARELEAIKAKADKTVSYIERKTAHVKVKLDDTAAKLQLAWLTKPAEKPIHLAIAGKSGTIIKDLVKSFNGYDAMTQFVTGLENLARSIDTVAIRGTVVAGAIGAIGNAAGAAAASVFSVGRGIADIARGSAAMAPAVILAGAGAMTVFQSAVSGLFDALGDKDKMAALTGSMKKEAEALTKAWEGLSKQINNTFWDEAGQSMSGFVDQLQKTKTLVPMAKSLGKAWKGFWDTLNDSSKSGQFGEIMDHSAEAVGILGQAIKPALRGFLKMGQVGSKYLPKLAHEIDGVAQRFESWVDQAAKSGELDRWIESAGQGFKDLGRVVGGVATSFSAVADAALAAGGPTLTQFADATERVGQAMKSARAQTFMTDIFSGAIEGAKEASKGLAILGNVIVDSGANIKAAAISTGKIASHLARDFAVAFTAPRFQSGILTALGDIERATQKMEPSFGHIGNVIGDVAQIAAADLESLAPTFNRLTKFVDDSLGKLRDPLIDFFQDFGDVVQGVSDIGLSALDKVVDAGSGMLSTYNKLPDPIKAAVLGLTGFAVAMPHLRAMHETLKSKLIPETTAFGKATRENQKILREQGKRVGLYRAGMLTFGQAINDTQRLAKGLGGSLTKTGAAFEYLDRQMNLGGNLSKVYDGFTRIGHGAGEMGRAVADSRTGFRQLGRYLRDDLKVAVDGSRKAFRRLAPDIAADLDRSLPRARRDFQRWGQSISSTLSNSISFTSGIGSKAKGFGASIASGISGATSKISEKIKPGLDRASATIGSWVTTTQRQVSKVGTTAAKPFKTVGTQVSKSFSSLKIPSKFAGGLKGIASGAKTATTAVGGLAKIAGGALVGALGGPAGIAIGAAAAGIGIYAQHVADAKEKFEAYKGTLNQVTGATTDQTRALAVQTATEDKHAIGIAKTGKNAYDVAKLVGVSQDTMTKAYEGNADAIKEVQQKTNDYYQTINREGGGKLDEYGAALEAVGRDVKKAGENHEQASSQISAVADALHISDTAAANASGQWTAFKESWSSATLSGDQMIGMLDTLSGHTLSAQDAAYNYQVSLSQAQGQLKAWAGSQKTSMATVAKGLLDTNGQFDMTKESSRQLYGILRQQVQPAMESVAKAFNNAGGGDAGMAAAKTQMQTVRKDFVDNLTEMTGISKSKASEIADALNIKPDAVDLVLDSAKADADLDAFANKVSSLANAPETIPIAVDGSAVYQTTADIQEALLNMASSASANTIKVTLDDGQVVEMKGKIDTDLEQLAAKEYLAHLGARDDATGIVDRVRALLDNGFNNKSYEAMLKAIDNASPTAEHADAIMKAFVQGDKTAVLNAIDNASEIGQDAQNNLKALVNGDYSANITANDQATPAANNAQQSLGGIVGSWVANLFANDGASGPAANAKGAMEGIQGNYTGTLSAVDNATAIVHSVEGAMSAIAGQVATIRIAVSGTGAVTAARAAIAQVKSKAVKVSVKAGSAGPVNALTKAIGRVKSKSVSVQAKIASHTPADKLHASITKLKGKSVNVKATVKGTPETGKLDSAIKKLRGKSVNVSAHVSGTGNVQSLSRAISSVHGKSVTITAHYRTTGKKPMANGGVLDFYKDGGIRLPASPMGINPRHRFMAENHVAQIAPAGAMRVWAEAETGGEAYIPLAKAKRSRSEDILSDVAARFGGRYSKARDREQVQTSQAGGDTYNLTVQTLKPDVASEVSDDIMFNLKHLRRGGRTGAQH